MTSFDRLARADAGADWFNRFTAHAPTSGRRTYRTAKRALDITVVIAFSPLWVPLLVLCASVIWFSAPSKSPIFKQNRTGYAGHSFTMYKIRTMVPNADTMADQVRHLSRYSDGFDIKIENDPRVTRTGKFLRATHLDELPQFVNVLAGDMSLVGPRPTSYTPDCYSLWHTRRLEVPPGIAGVWQLIQLDVPEIDDKVRLDVAYIERRSLWLDCQILVRTIFYFVSCVRRRR